MKTLDIRICGTLQGPIWWPFGAICQKEFDKHFNYQQEPFKYPIDCLRDALLHITNDGDFQNCEISFAVLIVTKQKGHNKIIRERVLQGTGKNSDCFCESELITN